MRLSFDGALAQYSGLGAFQSIPRIGPSSEDGSYPDAALVACLFMLISGARLLTAPEDSGSRIPPS